MPKIKNKIENCKHPNSRKTLSLSKHIQKASRRDNIKIGKHLKQNVVGEKLLWFRDQLPEDCSQPLENNEIAELIQLYLFRFDEELSQIKLKNSVGIRKNRQHASREDVISMTKKHEFEEYNTCGIELPDFTDAKQIIFLKQWDGDLKFLQNFKLRRFSKVQLIK